LNDTRDGDLSGEPICFGFFGGGFSSCRYRSLFVEFFIAVRIAVLGLAVFGEILSILAR